MLRKAVFALIIIVPLVALAALLMVRVSGFHQELKSCFDDVRGLKTGAVVRLAGVDVGIVRSVRAQPQSKGCPAEVDVELSTAYPMAVPRDAVTEIDTAGVLGESFVGIDVSHASEAPIENYGYLVSKPAKSQPSIVHALQGLADGIGGQKAPDRDTAQGPPPRGSQTKP